MKNKIKILLVSCSAFVFISGSAIAMTKLPDLYINNTPFASTFGKLKMEKGTAMISLRDIVERLKGEVEYKNNSIYITMPEASLLVSQVDGLTRGMQAVTPEEAVNTWIRGVQRRSGATQYAVMSQALQEKTKQEFEDHFWVTGGSSPHMGTVTKLNSKVISDSKVQISFTYPLVTQADGIIDYGKAQISLEKVTGGAEDCWVITEILLQDPDDTGLMIGAGKLDEK